MFGLFSAHFFSTTVAAVALWIYRKKRAFTTISNLSWPCAFSCCLKLLHTQHTANRIPPSKHQAEKLIKITRFSTRQSPNRAEESSGSSSSALLAAHWSPIGRRQSELTLSSSLRHRWIVRQQRWWRQQPMWRLMMYSYRPFHLWK